MFHTLVSSDLLTHCFSNHIIAEKCTKIDFLTENQFLWDVLGYPSAGHICHKKESTSFVQVQCIYRNKHKLQRVLSCWSQSHLSQLKLLCSFVLPLPLLECVDTGWLFWHASVSAVTVTITEPFSTGHFVSHLPVIYCACVDFDQWVTVVLCPDVTNVCSFHM